MAFNKLYLILYLLLITACTSKIPTSKMNKKIVIAHRGASGYLPEHTLEAKVMAYEMNADFIEQDLVLSKDNVPIVIHDIYLDDVTNVASVFPDRSRKDGRFYVVDFMLAELKVLQVTERFNPKTGKQVYPERFPKNKSTFSLHTFQEEIELIQSLNTVTGKNIGIYPEIKAPNFHKNEGKDISTIVLNILTNYGYTSKQDNCILQCFNAKELERIRKELQSDLFLVQLIDSEQETKQLEDFARYADGIGPWYKQIVKKENGQYKFSNLVAKAHNLGLVVHPYTLRADALDNFSSFDEMLGVLLFDAKIDGAFTDFPDKMIRFLENNN